MLFDLYTKALRYMYLLDLSKEVAIRYVVDCTGFSAQLQQFLITELNEFKE